MSVLLLSERIMVPWTFEYPEFGKRCAAHTKRENVPSTATMRAPWQGGSTAQDSDLCAHACTLNNQFVEFAGSGVV